MFRPEDFRDRLQEQPFRPFQLVLYTGRTYAIDHPELLQVFQRYLSVGILTSSASTIPDHGVNVAILHVVEIQDLVKPAPASGNGPAAPTS